MKALLLGSFNPIHYGHLSQITGLHRLGYDVELVISPHNPHKDIKSLMSFEDRVDICNVAVSDLYSGKIPSNVSINEIEKYMETPNYTYLTLRVLTDQFGEPPVIALGVDVINNLHTWKNYEEIIKYPIVKILRPEYELDESISSELNIVGTIYSDNNISSTMIRQKMESECDNLSYYMTERSEVLYRRIYNINKILQEKE